MWMVELQHAYIDAQEVCGVATIDNQFVQEMDIVVQGTDQLCGDRTATSYYINYLCYSLSIMYLKQ